MTTINTFFVILGLLLIVVFLTVGKFLDNLMVEQDYLDSLSDKEFLEKMIQAQRINDYADE